MKNTWLLTCIFHDVTISTLPGGDIPAPTVVKEIRRVAGVGFVPTRVVAFEYVVTYPEASKRFKQHTERKPSERWMMLSRDGVYRSFFLGLLLSFAFVLALGCSSLQQYKRDREDNRWICPEYADVPLRQGLFEEAIEEHLKVLSQDPDNGLARYHLGYAYGQLGLHTDEIGEYMKAMDLGMERGDLFYNLGWAYMELEEYDRAEQSFHRAVDIEPDFGENHRALGMAYYKQEHFLDAIISCRQATILEPNDPDCWHCLALASAKGDEVGESWNAVKQLRKLDPDYKLDPFLLEIFPSKGRSPTPNDPRDPR
jgi:tetratricopeptide (TPR) repeat protein